MLWWTGCVGCGPTCGGQRRCSEPERAGGEQAGALGLRSFDGGGCRKEGSRGNEQDRRRPVSAKLEAALLVDRAKPKTPAVESEVSVDRDRTLSRSCLVQKSKNFVYRARTTPLRFAVLSRLGVGKLAGPVCVLSGGVRRFSTTVGVPSHGSCQGGFSPGCLRIRSKRQPYILRGQSIGHCAMTF